ncbi:pimeloyl-ACP methyl ester carboxylesterase [Clostridium acetobutylicum]|uniref:Epoxide hydrolase, similar to eukaryotic n=1 Tax=Clostridium acetobutylicum (strain ATCC 824 / DSM 792 / JCM 1419 / IAM 19013 / LMG 5710 / NBRC 13948 / NRRL B-527 / VKM B-1787 / 2291 / W) TaxID=272562 RepID=Q97L46_CLOAB|nr:MULTISPECIES: epoxide hydrolase family protein [Clostridium]AAK78696.1 Epoxide hydrolase, similar to eukaryotic [Clostridium acetobutylicum ATCC 824]ADZ19770.1 Epoxide hydrolase [Clostridium acetobutylicum EA 2018]AEI31391.1 epoxide hydrolase [Clostridium acetobutylicum DSM 1731]AWV80416.1 epoxide hydrolase [Clostridium acetobutylicum]MBC2392605.1 epoxide hydrolase [Clostridium acetobutylicum]
MSIKRFNIKVSDEVLNNLKSRLKNVKWPDQLEDLGFERGTDLNYLKSLVSYWIEDFDWRAQETELNSFSQFHCKIDGIDIHFIHEHGKGPNPIPIILTHGWPDSYIRYKKLIPLLTDPAKYGGNPEDSFDVIVPSLPGFGFSGKPKYGGMNNSNVSELWAKLMTEKLGYNKFAAAGGDVGSGVTRYLALNHPELLIGIHLTDVGIIKALMTSQGNLKLSGEEVQYKKNASKWISEEGAYMSIQSTKPQTLAYGLSDSPVGLAAWIIEKFRAWSDCKGNLSRSFNMDELLTNIMIYWVTNTIGSSVNIYYENTHSLPSLSYIDVPTGMAIFPADILLPPKEWVERNLNITRWTTMPRGGHFTAMEEPELLAEEIRAFFKPYR